MATSAGLVSVTTGSLVVSGTLTSFVAAEGDQLVVRGITAIISQAVSPSQLQLKQPWPGPDISGVSAWDISLTGPYWQSTVVTNKRLSDLLSRWEAGPIKWDAAGPLADRAQYNGQGVGFVYLSVGNPWTLYTKLANTGSASDWSSGQVIKVDAAQSTVEAEAARDAAVAARDAAAASATSAQGNAGAAATSAGQAGTSATAAATSATAAANSATSAQTSAGSASSSATTATTQATTATTQAGLATTARQASEAARDLAVPAATTASNAAATATGAATTATTQAGIATTARSDATTQAGLAGDRATLALGAANNAARYAAMAGVQVFDFNADSASDASNDWNT